MTSLKRSGNVIGVWLHRVAKGRLDTFGDATVFRNLRRASGASVEIGTTPHDVQPEVLEGTERDRVWREVVLVRAPEVSKYERKAGRVIPVAMLRPTEVSDRA